MYELEIRRRQNGETVEVIAFLKRTSWEETRDMIIHRYDLEPLPSNKRRPGEARFGGFQEHNYDYILVARQVGVRPKIRALKAARRAFVGAGGDPEERGGRCMADLSVRRLRNVLEKKLEEK